MDNRPIGIFDSGVGGLTVLAKITEILPHESIIYVGDTANAPYGGKSKETLLKHGQDIIRFLQSKNVKAVVLACGTTSSTVYGQLVKDFQGLPLIDVIRPGVNACLELAGQNPQLRLGLIATATTIRSGLFERLIREKYPNISFVAQACPLFAPMVEAGVTGNPLAKWAAETYISGWYGKIDMLVLGCTHYPLLTDVLTKILGQNVRFIDLAAYTAQALKAQLAKTDSFCDGEGPSLYKYYVSGEPDVFNKTARFLLDSELEAVKTHSFI